MFSIFTEKGFTPEQQSDALKAVIEGIRTSSLWIALALAVLLIGIGIFISVKFKDKFRSYLKIAISIAFGFALSLISILIYLQISRMVIKGEITLYFWLLVGFAGTVLLSVITCSLLKIFKNKAFKYVVWGCAGLVVAYTIVILCLFPTEDGFTPYGSQALYISLSVILILLIALGAFLGDYKRQKTDNTKALTYAGICIAIAYALSYIKFFDGPQGSSVTLVSMLPIMLYSYMFGTKKGVIAGLVYGVLQCLQDPQIYEPLQVLLDYPIAFATLGLAGIFKGRKFLKGNRILEFVLGIILAGVLRYTTHFLSGYFVFYSYAAWSNSPLLQGSPLLYSLVYNTGVLIDAALDVVVGAILCASKSMLIYIDGVAPVIKIDSEKEQSETDNQSSEACTSNDN